MKKIVINQSAIGRQKGASLVEFTMILIMLFLVGGLYGAVTDDDAALDKLEEHERRYINSISAP